MKMKIKITKEILQRSMFCGVGGIGLGDISILSSCAIAVAVRDIFPNAKVGRDCIFPFDTCNNTIVIQHNQHAFIRIFDSLAPEKRLELPEFEFEVMIPDSVLELININDVHQSQNLELIS